MAQHSEPTGIQPSERSPLLAKTAPANGQRVVSPSVEAAAESAGVPASESIRGNGSVSRNGRDDEESQHQGQVDGKEARNGHVARIISVLLIGTYSLIQRLPIERFDVMNLEGS